MEIDLHGYHPDDLDPLLTEIGGRTDRFRPASWLNFSARRASTAFIAGPSYFRSGSEARIVVPGALRNDEIMPVGVEERKRSKTTCVISLCSYLASPLVH